MLTCLAEEIDLTVLINSHILTWYIKKRYPDLSEERDRLIFLVKGKLYLSGNRNVVTCPVKERDILTYMVK
jgi:hypothetical protein